MRTLDLLKALSPAEVKDIDKAVSVHKRANLAVLLRELKSYINSENDPDNAVLFQKVFDKKYSKDKDYLLRNELRLLNDILYHYLAERSALSQLYKSKSAFSYWLCRAYYERGMHNLLRTDIDEFTAESSLHKTALESLSVSEGTALMSLKSLWMIETQPKLLNNIRQQQKALGAWKTEEKKRFLYRLREMEAREAFLLNTLTDITEQKDSIPEDGRTPGDTVIDLSDLPLNDPLLEYILLKKHNYQTRGKAKLEVLEQTLILTRKPEAVAILGRRAYLTTLTQLGMYYILAGQYELGDTYLEQNLADSEAHNEPLSYSTIHNYLINQINLRNYKKGIDIYYRFQDLIDTNRLRHPSRLFTAYCYLYAGMPDEALALVPRETDLNLPLQIIARFAYPLSYLMRQEYKLALSELKNLRRKIKTIKTGDFDKQLSIVDVFIRYATAHTKRKAEQDKQLADLEAIISSDLLKWKKWAAVDVQLYWLLNRLM